jgi:SPP1 family predicted phage head-tail adaptor
LWASLTPVLARDTIEGAQTGVAVTHRIVIRNGPDLTTRHRLRKGGQVFRIVAYRDADGRGRYVDISAQEWRD